MPFPGRTAPGHILRAAAIALTCGLIAGLASASLAGTGVQWRLRANVPVICTIIEAGTLPDRPTGVAVTTSCNAERYQLVLHHGAEQAGLRAAHSSAGPVQISRNAVTISSTRPGYAITTIELAAPVTPEQLSVTLQPI